MRAFIDRIWAQLKEYLSNLPRKRKIQLAILALLASVGRNLDFVHIDSSINSRSWLILVAG